MLLGVDVSVVWIPWGYSLAPRYKSSFNLTMFPLVFPLFSPWFSSFLSSVFQNEQFQLPNLYIVGPAAADGTPSYKIHIIPESMGISCGHTWFLSTTFGSSFEKDVPRVTHTKTNCAAAGRADLRLTLKAATSSSKGFNGEAENAIDSQSNGGVLPLPSSEMM